MLGTTAKIKFWLWTLTFLTVGIFCNPAYSLLHQDRPSNILFVFSWHKDMPWQAEVENGFTRHFSAQGTKPNLYYEYMDSGRFSSQQQINIFKDYLKNKYAGRPIDYVIFESEPAARFLRTYPALFQQARIIVLNPGGVLDGFKQPLTIIPVRADYDQAIQELARVSHSKTVYVVAGSSPDSLARVKLFTDAAAKHTPDIKVNPLANLSMDEILEKVSGLEPDSVIFYLLITRDAKGDWYIPYDAAKQISLRASVPVYSLWTSLLGSGILGGYMLSGELVGKEAAMLLMKMDQQPEFDQVSITDNFHNHFFDWRQLKRWDMETDQLPSGSTVMFSQMNFYQTYYRELAVILTVMILAFFYIRYRELRKYNATINQAHQHLLEANQELSEVKHTLEEKNKLLEELSITDRLTGLYNRRYLDEAIREEIQRADRYQEGFSLIMADFDHFKKINDDYGHQVGDDILVNISRIMREHIRSTDKIGRWGGEEFMIICPNSNLQQTEQLAEKLRAVIMETQLDGLPMITCSFGVSTYKGGSDEIQLIKDTDQALYISKKSGRNRVSTV